MTPTDMLNLAATLNEILPNQRIAAIVAYRHLAGCSLKEAKDAIEQTPASKLGLLNPDPIARFVVLDNDTNDPDYLFVEDRLSEAEVILRGMARRSPGTPFTLYRAVAEAHTPVPEPNFRRL